ncbi:hypothetical protein SASPL_139245 [Salvia splendens]|uniref:AAA+ ATPase domain-containing protein n=1 Tax=Salvia splendens TaxID=180675 RepID=A0A8X8WWZ5_SALSN|nr:hypothetical protein SASPL_139245 [Salvia splendens]
MVSAAAFMSHRPLSAFKTYQRSNVLSCFPPVSSSSVDAEYAPRNRRMVSCACVAPPQNYQPADFKGAHKMYNSSINEEDEDGSDVLIECRDVYKSFGEKHILKGVSFKIRHGEAVGIIGPSGTGKSTILKIMAGLLAPDKTGIDCLLVVIIDYEQLGGGIDSQQKMTRVFQSAALFDSLTVHENVGFLLYENSTMPEDKIVELVTETLAAVGLKFASGSLDGPIREHVVIVIKNYAGF